MIRPLGDRVLVQQDEAKTETLSGLALPEPKKGQLITGEVVAVSQEVSVTIFVGAKVYYEYGLGIKVVLDNKPYYIVNFDDLLARDL